MYQYELGNHKSTMLKII